jgi:hypothetical protein
VLFFPKQLTIAQLDPLYPVAQEQTLVSTQTPLPEHISADGEIPKQEN